MRSLDEPLPGTEDVSFTLGDTIPDESAEAALEQIQDDWQCEQLRDCLDDSMAGMPLEMSAIIRARFYEDKTLRATADNLGTNPEHVRQMEAKGLRQLRKPQNARWLRPFLAAADCTGYGLNAFKNRGYVSRVEVLAGVW